MPEFRVVVTVRIKPSILDPQGRALERSLHRQGYAGVEGLRVGKHIEFRLAGDAEGVERTARELAREVLSNPVMEDAEVEVTELPG